MMRTAFLALLAALAASASADELRIQTREGRRVCGEESAFRISLVDGDGALKTNGSALVVIDNFGPAVQLSNRVDFARSNPVTVRGTLREPGFLRVSVDLPGVSRNLDDTPTMASVPYEHEKIVQGAPEPKDFDAFWQSALARLEREVPADVRCAEEPRLSTARVRAYRVSFATFGRRLHAWLSVPKNGKGPWPTRVDVPGAGCAARPRNLPADKVLFFISVLPFEPSVDNAENARRFAKMNAAYKAQYGVPRYPFAGMDRAPEEYFYFPVVVGAVRAVRWLATRPEVDPKRISYAGSSQGGGFGLYLAALAGDRFERAEIGVPALTDTLGWLKGRAGGWPHPELEWFGCDAKARDARIARVMPYFDGCNFAARAKCPLTLVAGLADWVCPPAAVVAAYNRIPRADSRLILAYGGSHHSATRIAADMKPDIRPPVAGALVAPDDADYLRRKWREDVTENGLGLKDLGVGGLARAKEKVAAGTPWIVAKAEVFAWMCDNMGVSASEHDFFPAISAYARWGRPMAKTTAWRDAQVNAKFLKAEAAAVKAAWLSGKFSMWKDFDHSVPAWDELLAGGWPMIERRLKACEKPTPYYRALRITLDACLRTLDRFAAAAREAAPRAATAEGRLRLEREAAAFAHIRVAPPETTYEALAFQFAFFFLSEHVDGLQVRSLGPLDQLLAPFYRADLAAKRITADEFRRLLAHYWWQWGSIDNYWGQPVALGGTNRDGSSAFNEVSELILDVHDTLALPTPKMIVKIATNTPDRVVERLFDLARRHRSLTFNSEETMTKILKNWRGCSDEECRTCDLNGCYEFYVHGDQNITQSSHINYLQPIHDLLVAYADSRPAPPTFDAFKAAYLAELKANTLACCDLTDAWERYLGEINPGNVYSLAVGRAVRDGKDAFYNGLKYNDTALLSVGLGTAVDALLAVKEIVYERRERSLRELGALMAANWKGGETLRMRMLRSKRKWGNNDPEANALGAQLTHAIGGWVNGRKNSRGGIWGFSGHPAKQFVVLMQHTGATPDGRLAGEESSKNVSATMGMDTEGVTALIETLGHLDPLDLPVNLPLDVMLHPSTVAGQKGLETMRALARVYFANGGITLQFNVVGVEELKDAQRHPENYENLQVRVCGWNVRWNDIPKVEQDKYILRAERIAERR